VATLLIEDRALAPLAASIARAEQDGVGESEAGAPDAELVADVGGAYEHLCPAKPEALPGPPRKFLKLLIAVACKAA
jgi:hypothetical protein